VRWEFLYVSIIRLKFALPYYLLNVFQGGLDPPHAKIAGDVMSCIFLNYSKHNVMELALPVAVKFLHKGNKDLSRNMSSYLSLAAIENAELLAKYIQGWDSPNCLQDLSGFRCLCQVIS
jgi:hypothetical protein